MFEGEGEAVEEEAEERELREDNEEAVMGRWERRMMMSPGWGGGCRYDIRVSPSGLTRRTLIHGHIKHMKHMYEAHEAHYAHLQWVLC